MPRPQLYILFCTFLAIYIMTRHSQNTASNAPATTSVSVNSVPIPATLKDSLPLPKMMVFDLDYTLWPMWIDTHVSPPLKPGKDNGLTIRDAYGASYGFYPDVASILASLKDNNILIGAASRTGTPDLARQMLGMLSIPGTEVRKATDMFDYSEIYPGSKTTHFQRIHKESGIPYEEMLFFDDEARNKNVETLGVVMLLVRNGVSRHEIDKGVELWRKRNNRMKKEEVA
ncbi:hypothetical protein LTR62_003229 [Meristemomyces frigidus]|uniref:Magnesium-dependent phosphatase-1 n=1 Tax=Meristemomyces frigidus TaxID=1508187 RepID=A0AAN7TL86_9PEZI|nr:hypothetical protein LTR62_003229 [Meristemomyces frigidus]